MRHRRGPALALLGALGLTLLTGCGGDAEPTVASAKSGSTETSATPDATTGAKSAGQELKDYLAAQGKYVDCLREQKLDVTDPDPKTGEFKVNSKVSKADLQVTKAFEACSSLAVEVPKSVEDANLQTLTAAELAKAQKYATCMQTSGAPDFPDPGPKGFPDVEWNQDSTGAMQATSKCAPIIGDPADQTGGIG